jgi:hypothetical protein
MNWTDSAHANLDAAGRWSPGLGDPSVMGWVTVAVYLLAAAMTGRVARAARAEGGAWRLWAALALVLLALGVNKQLDLQSLFTQVGRDLAMAQGWYAQRRWVQGGFIALLGLGALAVAWWLRRELREPAQRLAGLGLCVLLAFVVMRAASFHHMDELINLRLGGVRMNWVLELSGLFIILVAAWRARPGASAARARRAPHHDTPRRPTAALPPGIAMGPDVSPDDPPLVAWLRLRLTPLRARLAQRQLARLAAQRAAAGRGGSGPRR